MEKREYNWLDRVDSPRDLKRLSLDELRLYCDELRHYIIEQCAVNPGHLASSLGAVELAAAVHYVFDTPDDRLVWDVGHQAYAHKIITGRREAFRTNRKLGGISGFPRIAESPYDAFGGGHSSVSISAAFGMAKAAELRGEKRQVIAVIGDGAMTGGLAFEGMNNAGASRKTNMLVVLNDNNMAIDQATGALKSYLLHISTSKRYNAFKNRLWRWFAHVPPLLTLCRRAGNAVKHGLLQKSNLFESFNFRYFGPVDGHDVRALVTVLRALKEIDGPKLLHVMTVKGKGYSPAEHNQCEWHAPGRFNPETGERIASADGRDRYQDVFGQAGLAAAGIVPFCNIYSTFMQRAFDNVIHDVAIQRLPVVLCLDRGGLVGEDGATHHGAFDLAYFGCIPNLTVASPLDERELRNLLYTALQSGVPFVVRYPRGKGEGAAWRDEAFERLPIGRGRRLTEGDDMAVLTIGPVGNVAARAVKRAAAEGVSAAHYDLRFARPLDEELLDEVGRRFERVVTVEDGVVRGGVGSAVRDFFDRRGYRTQVRSLGIPDDRFVEHGTPAELYAQCGFDEEGILRAILER